MPSEPSPRYASVSSAGRRRRWWWGGAVMCLVLGVMLWAESRPSRWEWVGVATLEPVFVDMAAILAAGQAHAAGVDPYEVPNRFDFYGRPHVYGPGWFMTGSLGLAVADTFWVGGLLSGSFLLIMVVLFAPEGWRRAVLALLLLLSPPVLAALNRGNNDLFIVLLFLGAAWLSARRESVALVAVVVVLAAVALLKFYPLALAVTLLTLRVGARRQACLVLAWLVLLVCGLCAQWMHYAAALTVVPKASSIFSYQLSHALELLRVIFVEMPVRTWGGALAGSCLVGLLLWCGRTEWHRLLPVRGCWAFVTVGSASVWAACLLAGPSFSYRFIWLLPLAVWAANAGDELRAGRRALLGLILALGWAWWPKHQTANLLQGGDVSVDWLLMNAVGFEQVCLLGSFVVCGWMLTGWSLRRFLGDSPPRSPDVEDRHKTPAEDPRPTAYTP